MAEDEARTLREMFEAPNKTLIETFIRQQPDGGERIGNAGLECGHDRAIAAP